MIRRSGADSKLCAVTRRQCVKQTIPALGVSLIYAVAICSDLGCPRPARSGESVLQEDGWRNQAIHSKPSGAKGAEYISEEIYAPTE